MLTYVEEEAGLVGFSVGSLVQVDHLEEDVLVLLPGISVQKIMAMGKIYCITQHLK